MAACQYLGGISEIIAWLADQSDFHVSRKDIILEVIQSFELLTKMHVYTHICVCVCVGVYC